MRNWTKHGLQTALVTGGLLMLGTGIASADENVNPDLPASPLDVHASTPGVSDLAERLQHATPTDLKVPDAASSVPAVSPVPASQPKPSVFTVPAQLLRHSPLPTAAVVGNHDEPQINVPDGRELGVADLPSLPALPLLGTGQNTVPLIGQAASTPVNGEVPTLPLPMNGHVSTPSGASDTDALADVHNTTPAAVTTIAPVPPVPPQMPDTAAVPGHGERGDIPAQPSALAGLPLQDSLPLGASTLPAQLPSRLTGADLPLVPQLERMPVDGGISPFTGGDASPVSAAQKLASRVSGLVRK
ncbi:hypothetical protein [Amycolatopsis circi]|uniref:hypothetical protein n=1 Tax=Amycolatopsis circi TaxID=871959 RepID=UPI000E24CF0B|nr:hypothetical protein [Amycolatopsis circi]